MKMILYVGLLLSFVCANADRSVNRTSVCTFSSDTCGWINDPNSWKYRWIREISEPYQEDHALCLSVSSHASSDAPARLISQFSSRTSSSFLRKVNIGPVQARLWSPPVLSDDRLGCLTFLYRVGGITRKSSDFGPLLAVLLRQEGSCRQVLDSESGMPSVLCANQPIWRSADGPPATQWQTALISLETSHQSDYKILSYGSGP
ncbi:hypothetical protein CRM22_004594 [Opisthorchis felineus]|uniref:MAM domain-containing protein n=1 Tax=Opisthorchis felineus TaxID=147828 RepID=A0A4V3SFB4_OPIFE|nr:hypothetical protein CRM22_004594 [Opisthorchis felineus]